MTSRRHVALAAFAIAGLLAFRTFTNNPFWPRDAAGRNYLVNLHPSRFLSGSEWLNSAHWGCADWQYLGGNSFVYAVQQIAADSNNHADGFNTWDHVNWGANGILAVTYVRWTGNQMTDCDIQFNLGYAWSSRQTDPSADHSAVGYDMRAVARHECGHAIGLDHEDALLDCMNSVYTDGAGIPHVRVTAGGSGVYGMLPHADDKFGDRILYPPPVATPTTNLMCTTWREPAPSTGQARKLVLASSTFTAGAPIQVPIMVENQGNVSVGGGPSGPRLGVYLSTDTIITTGDTLIGQMTFPGSFGPHATGLFNAPATIPSTTLAGTYYIGVLLDDTNVVAESTELDNFAWYGPVTVNNLPDLVIDSIVPATTTPVRGTTMNMNITVRNAGFGPAVATAVHLYLQPVAGRFDAVYHLLGAPNFPALAAQQSITLPYSTVIPADICGGWWFTLHGEVDLGAWNQESNRNNNSFETPLQPQWPAAAGFYTGSQEAYLDGFNGGVGGGVRRLCTKGVGVNVTPTTWYLVLMGCSGTSPGIPMPPFGTLPLNYDVCTQLGLQLEGVYFTGSRGALATTPAGSIMGIQSGSWMAPVRGLPLDFAAIYLDVATQQLVGVSRNATRLVVR